MKNLQKATFNSIFLPVFCMNIQNLVIFTKFANF